jgi:NAD(P)-dependent dehydrogenase (short-subunit alcohol dehydrogenase family)
MQSKVVIVIGAGQSPGEGIGNGRASALLYAREGARVMAVVTRARELNRPRTEIAAMRDARVPLGRKMGSGWDTAYACLFLASDEAKFITGQTIVVDGGLTIA